MALAFKVMFFLFATLVMVKNVHPTRYVFWSGSLRYTLRSQNNILRYSTAIKETNRVTSFDNFWMAMTNLPQYLKRFKEARLCRAEEENENMRNIVNEIKGARDVKIDLGRIFGRGNVPTDDMMQQILRTKQRVKRKISDYINAPLRGDMRPEFELDLSHICRSDGNTPETEISITDVCPSVESCATGPNSYDDPKLEWLPELNTACDREQKCDRVKAFPLMAGLFWYQLNNWIAKRICLQRCDRWNDEVHKGYLKLLQEAKLLRAYASILPTFWSHTWSNFFTQAVDNSAYTNIQVAMSMVLEKEKFLNSTMLACNTLKFSDACPYADIFVEYLLIKKSQENRQNPSPVKDLRLYSNLDHGKMLGLQKDTSHHIELLGQIKTLGDNLQVSVSGISTYFQGVARYDEGIADKDVLYIQGEINKFNTSICGVVEEVKDNLKAVMDLVQAQLSLALVQEIADMAMVVAENSNPLKLFFSGPDLDELAAAANAIAEASVDVAQIVALKQAAEELANNTREISLALYNNQDQITGLQTLVNDIRQNRMVSVRENADKFIDEYGNYTPQVDRSALEKSNALWSAFKESACDLADGDVGIAGAIPKGILNAGLMCEKLEGTLAQFFTLREDMFDFQFQLVDAVARVVRGSISKRLAEGIRGKHDNLHANQLMIGFFMMQNKLQNVASAYCDILEYRRLGKPISACKTVNGLFRYEHLDDLVAFKDKSPYEIIEREVFIPTRASYNGDTGYISLSALKSGNAVFFKLPVNETWLRENRWILADKTDVPFVDSLTIYLPRKEYLRGEQRQHYTTQINVTTTGGSSINTLNPETRVVYILPKGHSSYLTVYEEGYSSCSREIENPYSLCNNLPKICDTSERHAGESVIPTVLSTWKVQISVSKGDENEPWDGPLSSTNLKIRAKVKLRVPLDQEDKKKRSLGKAVKAQLPAHDLSSDGCCQRNKYRVSTNTNQCADCPRASTMKHGGLYCQVDPIPE